MSSIVLDRDKIKVVYISDYYDGPLTVHAWYDSKYCYARMYSEEDESFTGSLYEVTGNSLMQIMCARQMFQDLVGYHWTTAVGRPNFSTETAIDFDGYYGKNGREENPYKKIFKYEPEKEDLIYIGDFKY